MNKIDALRAELKCREMVEGTNLNWWQALKFRGGITDRPWSFEYPLDQYEFAIHIIEGKPVFKDDELFVNGEKKTIVSKHPKCDSLQWMGVGRVLCGVPAKYWSWLPPKQKTVMVELPFETVKFLASFDIHGSDYMSLLSLSCKKELDKLESSK